MWIYQKVEQTVQLCKLSEYLYTDILHDCQIERITGEVHFVLSDIELITGYRYLCVSGHI